MIQGPVRRNRDLSDLPALPDLPAASTLHHHHQHHQQDQQQAWAPTLAATMTTEFREELARLDGVITPGVDDTPYVQYAIEALTRRDRESAYSADGSSSSEGLYDTIPRYMPQGLGYGYSNGYPGPSQPQQQQQNPHHVHSRPAAPAPAPVPAAPVKSGEDPGLAHQFEEDRRRLQTPFRANPAASAESLALSLLKAGKRPVQPHEWRPLDKDAIIARVGEQKANGVPSLNYKPRALRSASLLTFMLLCLLMAAALIFSAVWSELRSGLIPFDFQDGTAGAHYFLFRILPQLLAAVLLLWAQFIITTVFRIYPFVLLASHRADEREKALFQDMYPTSFLRCPPLIGPWNLWVPVLVMWIANFSIPLQSALFTTVALGDTRYWATIQGVAWVLVAMYLSLFASTAVLWRFWTRRDLNTGLIWDPRSLADVAAVISDTNVAEEYGGTQLAGSRDRIRFALKHLGDVRLGYWTWRDGKPGVWYTLGSSKTTDHYLPSPLAGGGSALSGAPDLMAAMKGAGRRGRHLHEKQRQVSGSGVPMMAGAADGGLFDNEYDVEEAIGRGAGDDALRALQGRYRYLPWSLRTSPLLFFVITALVLLAALFVVSFLPSVHLIERGFTPGVPLTSASPPTSGPGAGRPGTAAFSPAHFLYSFLPSFLGMLLFLAFQPLDMHMRILQPWAAMASPFDDRLLDEPTTADDVEKGAVEPQQPENNHYKGVTASKSLLADYAACGPIQSTIKAVGNGHWRVAAVSLFATLFVGIPVLAGGMFVEGRPSSFSSEDHSPRLYPNLPVYATLLGLLVLYIIGLAILIPARKRFRLPHSVTCLAEIIGFLANDDMLNDKAFKQCRTRDEMIRKMGASGNIPQSSQPSWVFGVWWSGGPSTSQIGAGNKGVAVSVGEDTMNLGVRRARKFTEKRKVRKSEIRRGPDRPMMVL